MKLNKDQYQIEHESVLDSIIDPIDIHKNYGEKYTPSIIKIMNSSRLSPNFNADIIEQEL